MQALALTMPETAPVVFPDQDPNTILIGRQCNLAQHSRVEPSNATGEISLTNGRMRVTVAICTTPAHYGYLWRDKFNKPFAG